MLSLGPMLYVSSTGHNIPTIPFEDLKMDRQPLMTGPFKAAFRAKLDNREVGDANRFVFTRFVIFRSWHSTHRCTRKLSGCYRMLPLRSVDKCAVCMQPLHKEYARVGVAHLPRCMHASEHVQSSGGYQRTDLIRKTRCVCLLRIQTDQQDVLMGMTRLALLASFDRF